MSDTVIDLTLSDDAGDSPYSPMSDFSDVSANQQTGECLFAFLFACMPCHTVMMLMVT